MAAFSTRTVRHSVENDEYLSQAFFAKKPWQQNCVISTMCASSHCGNCCDLVSHIFGKNFVKLTFLLKKLLKS